MSIRWRADGRMLCAARFPEEPGDTYQLSVISRCIVADVDHEQNGLWHWLHDGAGPYLRGQSERTRE